ncbi:MAG: nicotinamide riboside transporter PnuC [Mariniphaga sp.]|nr:nicotinamide riboside transporter PnuC [Mariniphaga sp.]
MTEFLTTWLWENKIELIGALLGLLYIYFSIKQHILTWPTGLFTSLLYIVVFFQSGFYADMGLQVYYVAISIYGWYFWLKGGKKNSVGHQKKLPARKTQIKLLLNLLLVTILIYAGLLFILLNFTNSTVPYMDSLTTALSITATWMLAKKYIEHWLIWIFADLFSAGLYVYKGLWPTVILFLVYSVMAVLGYIEWKKDLKEQN